MITSHRAVTLSRAEVVVSAMLRPVPVLLPLATFAAIGSLVGNPRAVALFWSLTMVVAGLALAVLAGARPLPRLAAQSHLLERLSWLGRYGTGAFLLCVSTFLGGLAGSAVPDGSVTEAANSLTALVQSVGLYAAQAAIFIFLPGSPSTRGASVPKVVRPDSRVQLLGSPALK